MKNLEINFKPLLVIFRRLVFYTNNFLTNNVTTPWAYSVLKNFEPIILIHTIEVIAKTLSWKVVGGRETYPVDYRSFYFAKDAIVFGGSSSRRIHVSSKKTKLFKSTNNVSILIRNWSNELFVTWPWRAEFSASMHVNKHQNPSLNPITLFNNQCCWHESFSESPEGAYSYSRKWKIGPIQQNSNYKLLVLLQLLHLGH